MPAPMVVTPASAPRPLNVVGEQVTVLASGAQTGGYEIFLQTGPEGCGPPPHSHPWDESFYVIKGEVEFGVDGKNTLASPGTLVHLPAGTIHWFRFRRGGAEMVSVTSCEGASKLFSAIDREISPESPDLAKLIEVAAHHGSTIRPPTN